MPEENLGGHEGKDPRVAGTRVSVGRVTRPLPAHPRVRRVAASRFAVGIVAGTSVCHFASSE